MKRRHIPPSEELKNVEGNMSDTEKESSIEREKFINLKEAIGEYSEQPIERISDSILETFSSGKFEVSRPSGYTHSGVVYRNFIYSFSRGATPEANDELNYTLFGLAIKNAMDKNSKFDKFVRDYIEDAKKADVDAWNNRKESYDQYIKFWKKADSDSKSKPEFLLDPENDRYIQGKIMAKFILGEM